MRLHGGGNPVGNSGKRVAATTNSEWTVHMNVAAGGSRIGTMDWFVFGGVGMTTVDETEERLLEVDRVLLTGSRLRSAGQVA